MDLESRDRWSACSMAKDDMFEHTDLEPARWYVVNADGKRRARLNGFSHLLSLLPYEDLTPPAPVLPPRQEQRRHVRRR